MSDNDRLRINPRYPLGQLVKALTSSGALASTRARQWQQVLTGLLDGSLAVGSRTPVADTPPWVTLEVVHGGFATGSLAAGGPLQPHEIAKLETVSQPQHATERGALNLYFLGDPGRSELAAMLADGRFRLQIPEEGALLIAVWLMEQGEGERALGLIGTILPFADRLRFYPVPHSRPLRTGIGVYVQTVAESIRSLRAKRPHAAVERMNEAIQVWTPLYDRAVSLFLETVEGEMPALQTTETGQLLRGVNGQPLVAGGWPCRHYPTDWTVRARQVLLDYEQARAQHSLCGKPEKPKENFARLRTYLALCVDNPGTLTGRDVGTIRKILASYVTHHGAPGSDRLYETRTAQAAAAARPMHHVLARVLANRMQEFPEDEGIAELPGLLGPVSADEAASVGTAAGEPLPPAVIAKAMRCLEAPLDTLIEQHIVPSGEVMAAVLPLLTARIRADAIDDLALRRVYEAEYRAFRRRRSLLLLDLQSQVRLEELPWIAAIQPWIGSDDAPRAAARAALFQATTLAIMAFPQTILPNKLVKELRALAAGANLSIPLVDELAADIFMGAFSATFLRAAQEAARLLRGTLYERYYGIPFEMILQMDDVEKRRFGAPTSPGFGRLCEELARTDSSNSWSVARNGAVIEQSQILTTHNLAALFNALDLAPSLHSDLHLLARRCFEWICRRQQMRIRDWRAELQMIKNTAYGWRQMLFYLSLLDQSELDSFLNWSNTCLEGQRDEFVRRFAPVMQGLTVVVRGDHFDAGGYHSPSGGRRFLGWSIGQHWLTTRNG